MASSESSSAATRIVWDLPAWLVEVTEPEPVAMRDVDARMRFVLELVTANIDRATGGPFAAAVFDRDSHELLASGVNLVMPSCCSSAHAEIVALSRAQQRLGCFDLAGGARRYELVSSTEPCAMCLGAIPWSGVTALVCGAADADARAAGFDEGHKPADWENALRSRGIAVDTAVEREAAAALLARYAAEGGAIYNAGTGAPE
ncbi:nucleoside deaminase [Algiphilus aromaticivorans]|uniref:nucleoside deaminase n=1 Tax=Algiphilus aromaticivorans TaxID=382454 RepID=UPI000694DC08|nr:nucleoside deaminase [Algiphilus aromaticivorans]